VHFHKLSQKLSIILKDFKRLKLGTHYIQAPNDQNFDPQKDILR